LTFGLSLSSFWLACADWAFHLANAPACRAALGINAVAHWGKFMETAAGAHAIDFAPQDRRFRGPLWRNPPYNLLYQGFLLAEGQFVAGSRCVSLGNIHLPSFLVGTEADHIAPWHSVYKLHLLSPDEVTFVLTSGGHNTGIVSKPGHPHRHFLFQIRKPGTPYQSPEKWQRAAHHQDGSWWLFWTKWLGWHSGKIISPPPLGAPEQGYLVLCAAPGTYVHEH
jgi:poly(3-hydroxyalkanoate) synthetase